VLLNYLYSVASTTLAQVGRQIENMSKARGETRILPYMTQRAGLESGPYHLDQYDDL
jgi:hypothetical protein